MTKQTLLLERVMDQTRLAVIEDGALCELYCQRPGTENVTGNIYLGRVENVLPGLNAAFVDIGMGKNGFLAAGDIRPDLRSERSLAKKLGALRIEDVAKPGQDILVQAVKAQPGAKGPRLSNQIELPGRLMVLLPRLDHVGVSRKIGDEAERRRLHDVGRTITAGGNCGVILRTAAEGASEDAIRNEFERLTALWRDISIRAEHGMAPRLLYDCGDLALMAVRDRLGERVDALWVDGNEDFERVQMLAKDMAPEWLDRVSLHNGSAPLFDLYRVDTQADKALQKYVWLKSGGSLVIEETEALTVVDVNTAKNTGERSAQDTIFANNLEAARELMRQLRLRDIGGIIVADFVDMVGEARRQALLDALREYAARDANRTNIVDITPLGLVEITRKKERQSLSRQLLHTCSHCGGNGTVFSHETTARRAIRDIWRLRRGGDGGALLCEAVPEVCGWMRTVGAPGGGRTYVRPVKDMEVGEYRISPVDIAALPPESKPLK